MRGPQCHQAALREDGELSRQREKQASHWMWDEVSESLIAALRDDPAIAILIPELEKAVISGQTTPGAAARTLLDEFRGGSDQAC